MSIRGICPKTRGAAKDLLMQAPVTYTRVVSKMICVMVADCANSKVVLCIKVNGETINLMVQESFTRERTKSSNVDLRRALSPTSVRSN